MWRLRPPQRVALTAAGTYLKREAQIASTVMGPLVINSLFGSSGRSKRVSPKWAPIRWGQWGQRDGMVWVNVRI